METAAGGFPLARGITVDLGGFEPWCVNAFDKRLKSKGLGGVYAVGAAELCLKRDGALAGEEYTLEVKAGSITVGASRERGVVQAFTTLYLLLEKGVVPCCKVSDKPRYNHRGFMLDCARHFFDTAEVKKILEEMAFLKLNVFHWHLSDDQGWRVESLVHTKLNELGGPYYTQGEIRNIVAFAKERGIEIIPEFDMPGHTSALLAAYPELSCKGEKVDIPDGGGIFKTIICAGKESSYSFLFSLLDEVSSLFESPSIHLGGDEAPKAEWENCPSCKAALEKSGAANFEDFQGYFTKTLAEHLAKKGKQVICWNDILKAKTRPENLTVQYWVEWDSEAAAVAYFESGGKMIFSDMFSLYFNNPDCFIPLEKVYRYEPGINGVSHTAAANTAGIEACLWTEGVFTPGQLEEAIFPRLIALAENAWSGPAPQGEGDDFESRLELKLKGLEERGVSYVPLEECNLEGDARVKAILRYWQETSAVMGGAPIALPPETLKRIQSAYVKGFALPEALLRQMATK
jgi:hexosaminidase